MIWAGGVWVSRLFIVFLIASCWFYSVATARTWTNVKGQQLEAELVEIRGNDIVIKSGRDQKVYTYKIEWLCRADQEYVDSLREDQAKPKPKPVAAPVPAVTPPSTTESSNEAVEVAQPARKINFKGAMVLLVGVGVAVTLFLLRKTITAFVFGSVAAIVCALIWASITIVTGYQIGWMAIGVGVVVGLAVRAGGKPHSFLQGIIGGGLALATCIVGNIFSAIGFIGEASGVSFFEALQTFDYSLAVEAYSVMFSPIDAFFYVLAMAEGFKLALGGGEEGEFASA